MCGDCVTQSSCFDYTVVVCRVSTHYEKNVVNMCSQSGNSKLPSSRDIVYDCKSNKPPSPRHHPSIMIFFAYCLPLPPPGPPVPVGNNIFPTSIFHSFSHRPEKPQKQTQVGHLKLKSSFIDAGTQINGVQHCQRQPCEIVRKNPARINDA